MSSTFINRVGHDNRLVDVYNERLNRWEREKLADLIATMPSMLNLEATFTHARKTRTTRLRLGWLPIRLPDWETPLWLLAIHDPDLNLDFGDGSLELVIILHLKSLFYIGFVLTDRTPAEQVFDYAIHD